ncbi:MAG: nucleotidyl transferase AbiEii/AbiGii toxin family protein [Gemmatimonadetes bacterium]|nr:nucleotidyl transferase AbiEii/AbiGii toxin family protein [Gemmatimonadota bacterium]
MSLLEYRYPLLQPLVHWEEFNCPLAPLEDLACMKLSALASRGSKKDFLDIYALGKTQFGLAEMLQLYRAKYATDDVAHVIMSLAYFDDAQQEEMPEMIWEVGWEQVERTLEGWVTDYTRRQIGGAE